MAFNPMTIKYETFVLRGDGSKYGLNNLITDLNWQETESDFVTRASLTLVNKYIGAIGGWTEHLTPPGSHIFIFANGKEVFRGTVWEHQYHSMNGSEDITITACDQMIYLSQSKDSYYYAEGQATIDNCAQLCSRWSIDMNYEYYAYTHGKIVAKNKSLLDQLNDILVECQDHNDGRKFVCQFEGGTLRIRGQGYNETVYVLTGGELDTRSLIDVQLSTSLSKLVTRVQVLGKGDDEGREPVEATIDGNLDFGVLQEIVYHDSEKSLDDAIASANGVIRDRGTPENVFSVSAPDIPFVRKGHRIRCVFSAEINGYFYVLSVTHNASDQTMSLKIERA